VLRYGKLAVKWPTPVGGPSVATEPVGIKPLLTFGEDFELDLRACELRRSGVALKLEPTPFGILALLLEQRGELVTREQIVERIWGKGVFLDTDNGINGAIRKIRLVLNDDPEQPRFIQTITGKGYRFIAPVVEPGETLHRLHVIEPPPSEQTDGVPLNIGRKKSRPYLAFAVLTAAIVVGLALWLVPLLSRRSSAAAPIRSIAVLPLDNLSGDPSQDYFADAMTDELITNLAKVGTLRVTSRTTVTLYKHTRKKLPEIARELNVDGIVEGSVVRVGPRVRITAQLIRAQSDQHLWAETYERDLGDALRLQSDVAGAIAEQVRAQLTPDLQAQFRSARTVDPQAYDAYLKGSYYLYNNQITTPGPLKQAKGYFEEAIRRDPNFSRAYSGLANAYIYLVFYGEGEISPEEGYKLAKEANRKALEVDSNNNEAYDVLGMLYWNADLDWNAADQAFNHSLALAPSYSCALEDRAMFLAFMGRRADALAELEKSEQVDPSATAIESHVYFQLRDWQHLVESGVREAASNPNDWRLHAELGAGYEGMGKLPEAIAEYQRAVDLSNGNFDAIASLGHADAVVGNRVEAEKILRELEDKSETAQVSPYLAATIYAGLGNKDRAFELLEQAYRDKSLDVAWVLKADPRIDNLRSDARFQNLLQRVGLTT
jgi:TolB-like protein/DNA-binding winged helix-turn-helix (wHTH) protein/Flp pilus assembly protein TadD